MEEVISRFSHLSENIFNSLDNKSIANSMIVSKFWKNYLKNQKIVQIRKTKAFVEEFHTAGEAWNEVFDTASSETIK